MSPTPYTRALDLLAMRPYSVADLRRKLRAKEIPAAEVEEVIERLQANGLLDDAKYAAQFARQKLLSGRAAGRRIRQELYRKGIGGEAAAAAVQQVVEEEGIDTAQAIEQVARRKLLSLGDLEPQVTRRRLYAFLARRGYDVDEIKRVVEKLCQPES